MNGPTCFRAAFQGLRASRGGPLRQRPAVRIVGRGWAFATVDMVAEAGRRAAFRPSGFAAGQWSTRADAPHAGGADDATTGALRERTAAALRCVSPALQRGASARGAGAEAAGANLAPLLAADARADQRPLVRRPSRGPTRPPLRRDPMARRKHIHRRGPGRRSGRPRRARPGQSHCAFQPSRPRHDRSEKNFPPFRPAAHAAGRNGGNKGRIVSTIIPVQNVKYHSGCTGEVRGRAARRPGASRSRRLRANPSSGPSSHLLPQGEKGRQPHFASLAPLARGRTTVNCVYAPGSVETSNVPPCCLTTMSWLSERPSPVPSPAGLVVKNGLNILAFTSSFIPVPLSRMAISTLSPKSRVEAVIVGS